jgi:Cd2+/Zn2+-exporting ATPase
MSKSRDSLAVAPNTDGVVKPPTDEGPGVDFRVAGMDCASCAAAIESAVRRLDGVRDVHVDVVGGRVRVRHSEEQVTRVDIAGAIRSAGYRVESDARGSAVDGQGSDFESVSPSFWDRRGRLVMTVAAGGVLALALLAPLFAAGTAVVTVLLAVSTIAGGWYVAPRGLRAARHLALDMNFLMSLAAAGAWIIGEPTEAAATLFLFAIAELLEAYSMDRARSAIKALMDLSPAEATVERRGVEERVPVADVSVGEIVVVRPGEKIAVDGDVVSGSSGVNQAPITGESMPVDKTLGDAVFAGSLNGQGALRVRATKPASDTTLARIVHAVEEAQASRAPSQRFVDRFARVYTPAVVGVALLIAVLPPLRGAGAWETWIYRALAMLVVACPCALVISTPVTIVSGLTGAARAGVLIKGGVHLENAGRATVVAFDKTGTLTRGEPAVTNVSPFGGRSDEELLRIALGVERHSEHPLARAIVAEAGRRGIEAPSSTDFEALVGRGARASVGDEVVFIGNKRLAEDIGAASPTTTLALRRFEAEGKTAVLVATVGEVFGVIAIADQVRPEAAGALADLRRAGVRRTLMLTGDNAGTARAVAETLGVTEYRAGLLPDEKVRIVRELEASGERVAFVGDGVNDAPALAAATVGVAMGAAGTDVALETADIALMADDLSKLSVAMRLSRKTLRVIRQNVAFSILVKAVFLVLAVGGWATLWMAVAADMGASLVVVANGLRALRIRAR